MCWRLFISTTEPLAPRDEPALTLGAPGPNAERIVAGLGGYVLEAGAHMGCACGFFASYVAGSTGASRRSEIAGLEDALDRREREELDDSTRSVSALASSLRQALESGPVSLYACWYGDEDEPFERTREASIAEVEDALEPVPEGVVIVIAAE